MTPDEAVTKLLATGVITDHRIEVKLLFEAVKDAATRRAAAKVRELQPGNLADIILRTGGLEAEE